LHSGVVTEAVLREFLAAGAMTPHVERLRERNAGRRSLALDAIGRMFPENTKVTVPRGGYMLWAEMPHRVDLPKVRAQAREKGIVFASGDVFFAGTSPVSAVRLNCAKAGEEELVRGIETLGHLLCNAS